MVAMAHQLPGGKYLTVAEAVEFMGCTDGWVRLLIRTGKLEAVQVGKRAYLISEKAAQAARDGLTTRSNGKRHDAVRPAADRNPAKRRRKPARKG
jgi:excisionase family DNA binding protein